MQKITITDQVNKNMRISIAYCAVLIAVLALLGLAIGGYLDPRHKQTWFLVSAVCGGIGIVVALFNWFFGSNLILKLSNARDANSQELQLLENVVEEMSIASGLPKPKFYLIEDESPNAFATGRGPQNGVVVVTTGLLRKLNRDELQAVVAHEMGHIRNDDIRFMTTVAIVAGLIPLLAGFFHYVPNSRKSKDSDNLIIIIWVIVGLLLAILAPIFAKIVQLAVGRKREFMADATAAELTRNPEGLIHALQKIAGDNDQLQSANHAIEHMYIVNPFNPFEKGMSKLFSTHPPIEERVAALQKLMGSF